jgi:hypothetical protein
MKYAIKSLINGDRYDCYYGGNTTVCISCARSNSDIRVMAIFNAEFIEPEILDLDNLTQVELMRTVIPGYDAQTIELRNSLESTRTQYGESSREFET